MRASRAILLGLILLAGCQIQQPPPGAIGVGEGDLPVARQPFDDYIGAGDDIDVLDDAQVFN